MNKQIFIALVIHAHYKQKKKKIIFNYGDIKQFFTPLLVINMY